MRTLFLLLMVCSAWCADVLNPTESKLPKDAASLVNVYEAEVGKLEAELAKAVAAKTDALRIKLIKAQESATKKGDLDGALAIKEVVEGLPKEAVKSTAMQFGKSKVAVVEAQLQPFQEWATAFSNRGYKWEGVPPEMRGLGYVMTAGGSPAPAAIAVKEAGVLYILIESADSATFASSGWVECADQKVSYTDSKRSSLSVYMKQCSPGVLTTPSPTGWAGVTVLAKGKM